MPLGNRHGCSAFARRPAEEFFAQVGVSVATRTTPPPKPDKEELAEMMKKTQMLAEKYRSEFLKP